MNDGKPVLIAIDHDDYHAKHIGITQDGLQFFLTSDCGRKSIPAAQINWQILF